MRTIEAQSKEDRELALKALRWIVNAKRPLQWAELQIALAIQEGQLELDKDDFVEPHDIVEQCGSLVILDELTDTIRLVHYTVEEFLLSVSSIQHEAHLMMANTCINYLLLNDVTHGPYMRMLEKNFLKYPDIGLTVQHAIESKSFLDYSGHYWGYHCRVSGEPEQLIDKALRLIRDPTHLDVVLLVFNSHAIWPYLNYERLIHPMHAASVLGLTGVFSRLLADGTHSVDVRDKMLWKALHSAVESAQDATVGLSLDKGADTNAKNKKDEAPLHQAAPSGDEVIVQKGADTCAKNNEGETPLHKAVRDKDKATIQLLLEKGTDINAKNNEGETPLHHAARDRDEATVQLLLEKGADIMRSVTQARRHYIKQLVMVAQRLSSCCLRRAPTSMRSVTQARRHYIKQLVIVAQRLSSCCLRRAPTSMRSVTQARRHYIKQLVMVAQRLSSCCLRRAPTSMRSVTQARRHYIKQLVIVS
jgi:hypothetical protein